MGLATGLATGGGRVASPARGLRRVAGLGLARLSDFKFGEYLFGASNAALEEAHLLRRNIFSIRVTRIDTCGKAAPFENFLKHTNNRSGWRCLGTHHAIPPWAKAPELAPKRP